MSKLIAAIAILFTLTANAEIGVVEQDTEVLKCSFSGETLIIQRSIPGVFPMMVKQDRNAVDAAMVPSSPFTAYELIDGEELILRDNLPGGGSIDYFVNFQPAQDGKFFITMSEDSEVASNSGSMASVLSADTDLGSLSGYGALANSDAAPVANTKEGVCEPAVNNELYVK